MGLSLRRQVLVITKVGGSFSGDWTNFGGRDDGGNERRLLRLYLRVVKSKAAYGNRVERGLLEAFLFC